MPSYNSNTTDVLGKLINKLRTIQTVTVSNISRTVATSVRASNIRRIHNSGEDVDGEEIGQYSPATKNIRQKKGKRIDKVNLTFTGKLSNELVVDSITDKIFGIGFITSYGSRLKEKHEEKYGKTIWGTTKEDRDAAQEEAENQVNRALNG